MSDRPKATMTTRRKHTIAAVVSAVGVLAALFAWWLTGVWLAFLTVVLAETLIVKLTPLMLWVVRRWG